MTSALTLKSQLRLLEGDLSNQQIQLNHRIKAASEMEQAVEFTKEQIVLIKAQLARCK